MQFTAYQPDNIVFTPGRAKSYADLNANDVICIQDASVIINDNHNKFGVYDSNGFLCPESILLRGRNNVPPRVHANVSGLPLIDEPVLYLGCGYVWVHFGHFLVEGLARTWALTYAKYKNMKVVVAYDKNQTMPSFVRKFLNALNVPDENIIVINKSTRFKKVFIPAQAMNIGMYMLPIMNKVFNKIATSLANKKFKTYDKIYLSRSAMNDGRTFGEKQVEKVFAKNGYKIIYPETLPLGNQITLAANCKEMAGTAGSALHLSLFMKPGGRVIQIKRNSTSADNICGQKLICDLRKLDLVWVYGSIETYQTSHFTNAPQIVGVTQHLLRFFDDNKYKYSEKDTVIDIKEMKKYKRQLRKYKAHKFYIKVVDVPVRLFSLAGITKRGRKIIRETLRKVVGF